MLVVSTFIIVVIMFAQRRQNARRHQRAVEVQIRDDLFRQNQGGGGSSHVQPSHNKHDRRTPSAAHAHHEREDGSQRDVRLVLHH